MTAARTVGVVGVGNMGGAMAQRLLAQGWRVQVCDLDPAKLAEFEGFGAVARSTPSQLAIDSVAIIVCVVDADQAREVLFGEHGAAAALQPGQAVLLCPTIAPQDVEDIAARLALGGIATIDAPMSGGPARARDGSMSLMLACADAVFERHRALVGEGLEQRPVFRRVVVAGQQLDLQHQRLGLDLGRTLEVIEQSSGQSWIGSDRMRRAIAGDYAPRAHVSLLQKDTRLALGAAEAAGFSGPLGAAAHDAFERAAQQGLAGLDDAALFKLLSRS